MKSCNTFAAWAVAALLASLAPQTLAGDGHDHGEAPAPSASPALPRFAAASELFELVGVVDGKEMTLYLDHFADNSPVKDASLELQLDGTAIPIETQGDGEFKATLQQALKPGVVSVTATVVTGQDADLLAGELDLHEDTDAHDVTQARGWQPYAPWLGGGVVALGLIGWGVLRKGKVRNHQPGGAA